ncbi:MAG: 3-deoxy-manno-octulosonate cytidylyltransferase [Bacteroidetes bacterium]|nr:3-deoxy-manno-octulosonate cytidylyltransferase [Bacteroidota bacterium]
MNTLGIIPARYQSVRFPGKPLVIIGGKTMIRRVYDRCSLSLNNVIVATDDKRISKEVESFGGHVIMTFQNHQSGTDRCAEAVTLYQKSHNEPVDIVINIQGDEPFLDPVMLSHLSKSFNDPEIQISTLIKKISSEEEIFNPHLPKVVADKNGMALYFSRSPIPYVRNIEKTKWAGEYPFYKHIGIYAFRTEILMEITQLSPSSLEKAESLEQNRWLENGYTIHVVETRHESISIDTPEDLEKINSMEIM